jgi:hypothetical protein
MAYIAAKTSNGGFFITDPSTFDSGPVIIFNMEDSLESTIKKRIENTDANQEVIYAVNEKVQFDDRGIAFIRKVVEDKKPALIIFDPMTSFLGEEVNMSSANEVRAKMEIPILLAREFDTAIICVMHTNKNEAADDLQNRVMGSVDFIGAVRSVLMVVRHPIGEGLNLVGHIKSNLSAPASTLTYQITDGKAVEFIAADPRPLAQVLAEYSNGIKSKLAKEEALDFAKEALKDGPVKIEELLDEGKQNGIAASTLKRALKDVALRRKISISGKGNRGKGYWIWFLLDQELRYRNVGHLDLLDLWGESEDSTSSKNDEKNQGDQEDHVSLTRVDGQEAAQ